MDARSENAKAADTQVADTRSGADDGGALDVRSDDGGAVDARSDNANAADTGVADTGGSYVNVIVRSQSSPIKISLTIAELDLPNTSIDHVVDTINSITGIPSDEIRLLHSGKQLACGRNFSDYNIHISCVGDAKFINLQLFQHCNVRGGGRVIGMPSSYDDSESSDEEIQLSSKKSSKRTKKNKSEKKKKKKHPPANSEKKKKQRQRSKKRKATAALLDDNVSKPPAPAARVSLDGDNVSVYTLSCTLTTTCHS